MSSERPNDSLPEQTRNRLKSESILGRAAVESEIVTISAEATSSDASDTGIVARKRQLLDEHVALFTQVANFAYALDDDLSPPELPGLSDAGRRYLQTPEGRLLAVRWARTFERTIEALTDDSADEVELPATREWADLVRTMSAALSLLVRKANASG